ncbi:MAG: Hsp20/alpha crystallin family protein [Ruminococcus sp.]|jgi:HSP20 family protein
MLMPSIFNDNFFDDFMKDFPFYSDSEMKKAGKKLYGHHGGHLMRTDVKELDDSYEIFVDLPGFKKDEIKVSLDNGYLTIAAEKERDEEENKKNGKYIRRERYIGSCERSFYVGELITEEDIKGEFKHGVLKLFVPKKNANPAAEEKKYISIEG